MKNKVTLVSVICFFLFQGVANAQKVTVPTPKIYFAFDSENVGYESVSKINESVSGTCERIADRFGNANRAIRFSGEGSGITCNTLSIRSTNSVSFWIYIPDPSNIPEGPTPFLDSDKSQQIYNWTDGQDKILRGVARKKATIGLNRYIDIHDGTRKPWYLWAYEPAQFDETGWYHIFVVQASRYTRLVMYKPSNKKTYFYNWLGAQSFEDKRHLYIGGYADSLGVEGGMDDFKVYNEELTDDQIETLHTMEYPMNGYFKLQNRYSAKYATVEDAAMVDGASIIQYYTGSGNNEWKLQSTGQHNEYRIVNLHSNKLLVVKDASTAVGAEVIQHRQNNTDNEIWSLECSVQDPRYYKLRNKNSSLYLCVRNNSLEDRAKLIQGRIAEETDYWYFEEATPIVENIEIEPGLYRLKNKKSGFYLDVQNRSTDANTSLTQEMEHWTRNSNLWIISKTYANGFYVENLVSRLYMKTAGDNELFCPILQGETESDNRDIWQFIKTGVDGEFKLRNAHNYMYAVVQDASTSTGAKIVQYPTADTENSIWILEKYFYNDSPVSHGWYKLINQNSEKPMVVENASLDNYAPLIQYSTYDKNGIFELVENDYGLITLQNVNSNKYVVVKYASLDDYASIVQYEGFPTANGLWRISRSYTPQGSGFELTNLKSGLIMAVEDASHLDGASIIQNSTAVENGTWNFQIAPQPRSYKLISTSRIAPLNENVDLIVNPQQGTVIIHNLSNSPLNNLSVEISSPSGLTYYKNDNFSIPSFENFSLYDVKGKLNYKGMYIIKVTDKQGNKISTKKFAL